MNLGTQSGRNQGIDLSENQFNSLLMNMNGNNEGINNPAFYETP